MYINAHTHTCRQKGIEILNLENTNEEALYFSIGIHPHQAHEEELNFEYISKTSQLTNGLAIGECGLDKLITTSLEIQTEVFKKQIEISEKQQLPIILHCVKAWNEVLKIKKELQPKQPWIFHGFRKTTLLESVLENKLMISIGTPLIYDSKLQTAFKKIPIDQLFLETDSDDRFSIEEVYAKAAELLEIPLHRLKSQILENFKRTFSKFNA